MDEPLRYVCANLHHPAKKVISQVDSVALIEKPSDWDVISTQPSSGVENMEFDRTTLQNLQQGNRPPLVRFFRFRQPTVSYGRHQTLDKILHLIPKGWDSVQRPTGGGVVYHQKDLCMSLCWRNGQAPLPDSHRDQYAWIHRVILSALQPFLQVQLASCRECAPSPSPFALRQCFNEPVAYDLLYRGEKIVGGALCHQKGATLYQGSLQGISDPTLEDRLSLAFQQALTPAP